MQIKNLTKTKGAVTLLAVLIIGLIITTIMIVSSIYNRLSVLNTRIVKTNEQNMYFSETCAEKALLNIRNNRTYTGSGTFTDGSLNCSYVVTNNGSNSRLIQASSTINGFLYKTEIDITMNSTYLSIDYWKRI